MKVSVSRSYHAVVDGHDMARMPDGLSAFKVYFVSIIGRDEPSKYEWEHCPLTRTGVLDRLQETALEGIGFVTAFPHITKLFRYDPNAEILLTVRAFQTQDFTPLDLQRDEGMTEFACFAEAMLAAEEYTFWAEATSIPAYLETWSSVRETPIADAGKMRAYYEAPHIHQG